MKSLHPVSENPPPERTKAFWPSVRFFIETIWALFGGPETIAAMHALSRGEHQLLASWLRKAEILVRKLLLIEAAEIQLVEKKYKPVAKPTRAARERVFYADEPQLWRVAFKLAEARAMRSVSARIAANSDSRFPSAWPLAERFEALLRVFDAPEAYIKRAARLLRRARDIAALAAVPLIEGYDDIFEPLRPLLCGVLAAQTVDTS